MGLTYTVAFENRSSRTGTTCIYQDEPEPATAHKRLAWLCQDVQPGGKLTFQWSLDYAFVWGTPGQLTPGVVLEPAQIIPSDVFFTNGIKLTGRDGIHFEEPPFTWGSGSVSILCDSMIPLGVASMAIRVSGADAFALEAMPNLEFRVSLEPQYWITFGEFTAGEVLDLTTIADKALLPFPPNTFRLLVILDEKGSWTVVSQQD